VEEETVKKRVALVWGVLSLSLSAALPAQAGEGKDPVKVSFNGTEYVHRWSKDGQNEFTPAGQENLDAWKSMVTINVYADTRSGEDLALLANKVLGKYQAAGKILRTDSRPRTKAKEAEHFVAVLFPRPEYIEVAFARFLLLEKKGVVVVSSQRVYGKKAGDETAAWLDKNGPATEKALMAWNGIPSVASLAGLPQSKTR
jgi:hypothetical protein